MPEDRRVALLREALNQRRVRGAHQLPKQADDRRNRAGSGSSSPYLKSFSTSRW